MLLDQNRSYNQGTTFFKFQNLAGQKFMRISGYIHSNKLYFKVVLYYIYSHCHQVTIFL